MYEPYCLFSSGKISDCCEIRISLPDFGSDLSRICISIYCEYPSSCRRRFLPELLEAVGEFTQLPEARYVRQNRSPSRHSLDLTGADSVSLIKSALMFHVKHHSASTGMKPNFVTSNNPISVSFTSGITARLRKVNVITGSNARLIPNSWCAVS